MLALGHRRHRQLSLLRGPIGLSGHVYHTSKHRVIGITGSALGYVATRHRHKRRPCETPRLLWLQAGSTLVPVRSDGVGLRVLERVDAHC